MTQDEIKSFLKEQSYLFDYGAMKIKEIQLMHHIVYKTLEVMGSVKTFFHSFARSEENANENYA